MKNVSIWEIIDLYGKRLGIEICMGLYRTIQSDMNEEFNSLVSLIKSILLDLRHRNYEAGDNEPIIEEIITLSQCICEFQANNTLDLDRIRSFYRNNSNAYSAFLVNNVSKISEEIENIKNEIISQLQSKSSKNYLKDYTIEKIGLESYRYEEILNDKKISEEIKRRIWLIIIKCNFVRLVYEFFSVGVECGYLFDQAFITENDVQFAPPQVGDDKPEAAKKKKSSSEYKKRQLRIEKNVEKYYNLSVLRRNNLKEKVQKLSTTTNEALKLIEQFKKEVQVFCTLFGVDNDDSSGLSYVICDISSKMNDLIKEFNDFKTNYYQVPIELTGDHMSIKSAQNYIENSMSNYALLEENQKLKERTQNIVIVHQCMKISEEKNELVNISPNSLHLNDEKQITMCTLESLMANLLRIKSDETLSYDKKGIKNLKSKVIQLQQKLASSNPLEVSSFNTSFSETVNEYHQIKLTKKPKNNMTAFDRLDALSRFKASK